MEGAKGVSTPAVKPSRKQIDTDLELEEREVTHYRAIAAKANYLSADRPECQFGSKEVCRSMSKPTELGAEALKRIGRYLVKRPRLVYKFPYQKHIDALDVYADTDHCGCLKTRKSTSGGCVQLGQHLLKSWSSTQPTITLSSGESELHGAVRGCAVGLGFLSLLADLGVHLPLRVWTDSTASKGICGRQGLGKVRHLDAQELCVQQRVRNGDLSLLKIGGEENPADLFTKASLTHHRVVTLLQLLGCYYRGGRPAAAPALRNIPGKSRTLKTRPTAGWTDDEEEWSREHSREEVMELLRKHGLPHGRAHQYRPES